MLGWIRLFYKTYYQPNMSQNIPHSLVEWVQQLGLEDQLTTQEIESGRAIGRIMKIVVPEYNLQLLSSNSAVNRVSNWNNLINQLKKVGIRVSQDEKTKIINGNHDVVYQIMARLHDFYTKNQKQTQVDISKINPKSQIGDSSSLLQLFILCIIKYFNLSPKESVALLSSQCKYLAHILVKGFKNQLKPVEGFISQLIKHIEIINTFCKNRENQLFFIRAIKPSLISKSDIASQKGMSLLQQFLAPLNNKYEMVKEHLISTFILAIRRHPHLIDQILKFAIRSTNFSKDLLMLFKPEASEVQLQNIFMTLFHISKQTRQTSQFFNLKGVNQIINKSVQNIKNSETATSSMNLLLTLSSENTDLLSDPERGSKFIQHIQQVTISKRSDSIAFIQQLFAMLSIFGKDKNQLAPAIFKILILKFQTTLNTEQARIYISNFKQIIEQFPTIPFSLIIDAINTKVQTNTLVTSQSEIEFFQLALSNEGLDAKSALVIYNVVSKLLVEQPAYATVCSDLLMGIVRRFNAESIVVDLSIKLIKVCLAIHFANVKRLAAKRRSVTGSSKIQLEDAIFKSKNFAMEEFIYKMVEQGVTQINKNSEPLICYSLIQVEHISKQNAEGLRKIVSLFGNPSEVIKKYQAEAKKLQEEEHRKEDVKKSKLKQSAWAAKNRYDQGNSQPDQRERGSSHVSSDDALKNSKLKSKLDPMLLSHVGVTPAAMKGLQKYQKTFLNKVEKAQQEQAKRKEEEERQIELKKIFQRKMLEKGIEVKKIKDQEFRYIYDFGVKEKQIQMDTVKNSFDIPFYHPDYEEDRDVKGLQSSIKKYQKILKLYYNIYSGHIKPKNLDSFDQIAQKVNLMYSAHLWKFLKDHTLDEFITVREVQYLSKKINHNLEKKFDDSTALDYQGFENFIIQASICMFTRPPKDLRGHPISEMIEQTISRLKLYASQNKVNEKLFEDPDNIFYNQTEAVKELNKKLQNNPDYILPEGYKKITQKKVIFTHRIFLDAMSSSYKDVYEIIDDMLFKGLGVHIIQPFTTYQTIAKARPTLYFKQRPEGEVNSEKLSGFIKKQVAKIPMKDRQIGKQVGVLLDQIIEAVQFGHDQIGIKHENKLLKEKKMQQEEITKKQLQQKKRWAQRNREIKSALVKHKQVVAEKQKQQQEKKQEEKRKQQEEKKKKQLQEQRLKQKVESYQNKKKQDEERRKKEQAERKRKEKQDMERKKKESEQIKKKIEETKQKKQEQEKQRKKMEELAEKEKKAMEKKKLEEEQKKKKEMIQQYKNKKTQGINQSQLSQSPGNNRSELKALDTKLGSNIERKKLT